MANLPTPRITTLMDLADIVTEIGPLLQEKFDRDGSAVADDDTNTRAGAAWPNAVDDWLMALQERIDSLSAGMASVLDTRSAGSVTTASIAGLASGNFEITTPSDRMRFDFVRCLSNSSELGPTGRLQFYADTGRTKLVYDSALQMGEPPVDVDDFIDTLSWGAYADDNSDLVDEILYGTVTNGGAGASTFTIYVVGVGY